MKHLRYLLIYLCLLSLPYSSFAQSQIPTRPKIGLVLGGGGARGAAHVGVIRVLEELQVPIDYVVGTSMGAIVGGLYASGMSADEIEQAFHEVDWQDVFTDDPARAIWSFRRKRDDDDFLIKYSIGFNDWKITLPSGLIQGQKFDIYLNRFFLAQANIEDFDRLAVPFRAVATDLATGEPVILGQGELTTAIRASMAIPGLFAATSYQDKLLIDGGVSNNLPVDVARSLGADIIIAVDTGSLLLSKEELTSYLSISKQLVTIMTRKNAQHNQQLLGKKDILISPDLNGFGSSDFDRISDGIPLGEQAARMRLDKLSALAGLGKADRSVRAETRKPPVKSYVIDQVRITNKTKLSDELIRARFNVEEGKPLDLKQLEYDISVLYGLRIFDKVNYRILAEEDQTILEIIVVERSWGPGYVNFGLELEENFSGDNSFDLTVAHTLTEINRLNGEWRTLLRIGENPKLMTEVHQPLDYASHYFVAARLQGERRNTNEFEDGRILAEYRVIERAISMDIGRELGNWGELRGGLVRGTGEVNLGVGDPSLPDSEFERGLLFVRLTVDTIDNASFPHSGQFGKIEWASSRDSLGADSNFEQLSLSWSGARTWGRHTTNFALAYHTTLDEDAPLQDRFLLGGFLNLSGYQQDELSGQHAALVRAMYYRRIGDFNFNPTYLGLSLEAGNVWQSRSEIEANDLLMAGSVFIGMDTFFGPFYLAAGLAEENKDAVYLSLKRTF